MPRAAHAQPDLFPPPPPPSYPEQARARLGIWLDELGAAADGSWAAEKAAARARLLPDLASWLPDEEAGPIKERIGRELKRVAG